MELVEVNDGWEDRLQVMKEELDIVFSVNILGGTEWREAHGACPLTDEELVRLEPKVQIVTKLASKLAWNMVKGTIKYSKDEYELDTWFDMLIDDAADALNYAMLARSAYEKEQRNVSMECQACGGECEACRC